MRERSSWPVTGFAILTPALVFAGSCSKSFSECKATRSCSPEPNIAEAGTNDGGFDASAIESGSCPVGFLDCNGDASDCETEVATDPDHCGACDTACSTDGVTQRTCVDGVCHPVCDATHVDCNGDGLDGCEIDVSSNVDNCGGCNQPCSADGVTQRSCIDGVCQAMCDAMFADCNGDGRDGCEIDLTSDADNCGACDRACGMANASVRVCNAGTCAPVCATSFADCDTPTDPDVDDGCETSLDMPDDCGACGHSCLGGGCANEQCQPLVLGSALWAPRGLAVDDQWVHWVENDASGGKVVRNSVMGSAGTATDLILNQPNPGDLDTDGQYVYWTTADTSGGAISRIQSGSAGITVIASSTTDPTLIFGAATLEVDDTNIYFWDIGPGPGPGAVYALPKTGGTLLPLFTGLDWPVRDIAVDATHIFLAGTYLAVSLISAATGSNVAGVMPIRAIALDADYMYFQSMVQQPVIARLPKVADSPLQVVTPLVDQLPTVQAMTIQNGKLYFATGSAIYVVDAAENATARLLSADVDAPNAIVVYGGAVYWVNGGAPGTVTGSVMKLAL